MTLTPPDAQATVPGQAGLPTEARTVPTEARQVVDAMRHTVADLHRRLTQYGLVVWTAGNVSARCPGTT